MRTDLFLYGRVLNREKDGCKEWPVPNASTLSWKGEPLVYMPFVYEHPEYWKKVLDMILSTQNTIAMERKLMMIIYEYGNPDADNVLIQLTGDHELSGLENEVEEIRKRTSIDFRFIAAKVDDWNYELSPWKAPAVFGNEDFGDGAARTLEQILTLCTDKSKAYYIGGYSLAGLFSLWAAYQTDIFSGVAAASPSVWFPGFIAYMKEHEINSETVYLSLGDREEKTRNPVMSQVGNCIQKGYDWLTKCGITCTLEWNQGNHFREPDIRTAKAFAWVLTEKERMEQGIIYNPNVSELTDE